MPQDSTLLPLWALTDTQMAGKNVAAATLKNQIQYGWD